MTQIPEAAIEAGRQAIYRKFRYFPSFDTAEIIIAAADAARGRSYEEWRPIETAPKDGTAIRVSNEYGEWIAKYQPVHVSGYQPENPWFSLILNSHYMRKGYNLRPTHWLPLIDAAPPHNPGTTSAIDTTGATVIVGVADGDAREAPAVNAEREARDALVAAAYEMADKTADAYRYAEGRCIDALVSLRRFAGSEAIESLRAAIRMVEQEQARARREDRLRFGRIMPPARGCPPDVQF